jgi:putative redox protein
MTKIKATYRGDLRVECKHQSGVCLETDAPKDNEGKGENFSPTDLLPAALATCMLTLMGVAARKLDVDLKGSSIDVDKEMFSAPRRIGRIVIRFHSILSPSAEVREKLEKAALSCPVHYSLHPDIIQDIHFTWGKI